MTDTELIRSLHRLKVETGSLACWGCGHEHNCGIHGCAVIRQAAERLEELRQEKALRRTEGEEKSLHTYSNTKGQECQWIR